MIILFVIIACVNPLLAEAEEMARELGASSGGTFELTTGARAQPDL